MVKSTLSPQIKLWQPSATCIVSSNIQNFQDLIFQKFLEVEESIVIGQDWEKDRHIILFIKLAIGQQLDKKPTQKIKTQLKEKASF